MSVKTTVVLELTLMEAGAVCMAVSALALNAPSGELPPGVDADSLRTAIRKLLVAGEVGGTKAELRLRDAELRLRDAELRLRDVGGFQ